MWVEAHPKAIISNMPPKMSKIFPFKGKFHLFLFRDYIVNKIKNCWSITELSLSWTTWKLQLDAVGL